MLSWGICSYDPEGWWFWTMSFTQSCISSLVTWLNILLHIEVIFMDIAQKS